ncbi:T9SS type A sorting domain-containing protein [Portibacter lacus]|uniref:Secretion system C-terminal sorting domain-containing protein n=1 Tax=Portibacter lacus TaxID=1099794 RepID=A0AA37SQU2_9BACT|nr:T9SS type A sorting domain-containing protein [Portibacter lacus]GLR19216.1 hypothetical protein GCM10007940_38320 [Portibacter lacus]
MRSIFLFFVLALSINSIQGQQITLNDEFASTIIKDVHFLGADRYVQALIIEDYATKGVIQWIENNQITKQVIIDNEIENMRFRIEPEGIKLDVQTHFFECDLNIPTFESILLDTIASDKINFAYDNFLTFDYIDAYNFGDSVSYFLTNDKTIIKKDIKVENDLVFNVDFFDNLLDFKFKNDKVFIYGEDSLLSINIYSADTSLYVTGGNYINDMAEKGELLYVVGSESLDIFDENGSKINTLDFPEDLKFAVQILIENDQVFLLGNNLVDHKVIYELLNDDSFLLIYEEKNETIEVKNMHWNPYAGLVLVGNTKYQADTYSQSSNAVIIDLEKEEINAPDLELSIENIEAIKNENADGYYLQATLLVTNHSQDTARNMNIYSTVADVVWCMTSRFIHNEQVLSPGESRQITEKINFFYPTDHINENLCFWVNGSNRLFDPEIENHYACQQVVGTEELSKINQITISPNPVQDVLNINGDFIGNTYTIFTMHGQKIEQGSFTNEINTESLLPGIYFLQVSKEDKMQTLKFVKAE